MNHKLTTIKIDKQNITVLINGVKYTRASPGYSEPCDLFKNTVDNQNPFPDVICKCGNDEFTLKYGSYTLIARCTKCNGKGCVYSG